jgi:hypothetical protein
MRVFSGRLLDICDPIARTIAEFTSLFTPGSDIAAISPTAIPTDPSVVVKQMAAIHVRMGMASSWPRSMSAV